jgi:hypothetical protein
MKIINTIGFSIALLSSANGYANSNIVDQTLITSSLQEILISNINEITSETLPINSDKLVANASFKGIQITISTKGNNKYNTPKTAKLAD